MIEETVTHRLDTIRRLQGVLPPSIGEQEEETKPESVFCIFSHNQYFHYFLNSLLFWMQVNVQFISLLHDKESHVVFNTATVKNNPNQYTCFRMSN